ncbi:hypothetical protein N325_07849, partial [Colius striatus]
RANVYPTREFLARGRQDNFNKTCRHCNSEIESTAHIIGFCPSVQQARIKRHNYVCEILIEEARKCDWLVFQEPLIRDECNELFKPDLVFVKDQTAQVVDVTIRFENQSATLKEAAEEKVNKYKHLEHQIKELTNASIVKFSGFPLGSRGKWFEGNFELLTELGLSASRHEKVTRQLSNKALFTSVDIIHMFASSAKR